MFEYIDSDQTSVTSLMLTMVVDDESEFGTFCPFSQQLQQVAAFKPDQSSVSVISFYSEITLTVFSLKSC